MLSPSEAQAPGVAPARAILARLAGEGGPPIHLDRRLAGWLTRHDLAALGRAAFRESDPAFAALLTPAALGAAAANLSHFETLAEIERRFESRRIGIVLLKGAAVATWAYADPYLRPMTDLDLWVRAADMAGACAVLEEAGFVQQPGLPHRPEALQRRSGGELVFRRARDRHGLVELHFSPFPGWWIQRTARPDLEGLWERSVPAGPGRHARRLAVEDAILQTAFHVVVNQFGQAPLRGLMDLATMARSCPIEWDAVADRARSWRVAHAIWIALDTAHRLIGLPGAEACLRELRPGWTRRAVLRTFMTPAALLAGRDLTRPARRHPFMLAICDRPRDGARLVGRTVWPERWWMAARHGRPASRLSHLGRLLRRGEV